MTHAYESEMLERVGIKMLHAMMIRGAVYSDDKAKTAKIALDFAQAFIDEYKKRR